MPDQGGSLTAVAVPPDQIQNFLDAASALESPPETGGDVSVTMLFEPPDGPVILTMGSSLSTEREVKAIRAQLLADSDWTQLLDAPLTAAKQAQWASYRQELRDLPAQPGYPGSVSWPVKPT